MSFETDHPMLGKAESLLREAERIRWSFLRAAAARAGGGALGGPSWGPQLNVVEDGEGLWVLAALPGASPRDLEVRLEEESLTIRGRRALRGEWEGGMVHVLEIPCGPFERRLRLPRQESYVLGTIQLCEGLLTVLLRRLPRPPSPSPAGPSPSSP